MVVLRGLLPGFVAGVLAGCAVQPVAPFPAPSNALSARPAPGALRVGVEYLPPMAGDTPAPVADVGAHLESLAGTTPPEPSPKVEEPLERRHTWTLTTDDLGAMPGPMARETVRFVEDLVEADRRRSGHERREPFFDLQPPPPDEGPRLWSEVAHDADREQWLQEHGPGLLRKPLQQLLLRLPPARAFEVEVTNFRAEHVPLSEPYRQTHRDQRKLGRLSLRLHTGDRDDPVELVYIRSGVRLGSSRTRGKATVEVPIAARLSVALRADLDYDTGDRRLRAELLYRPSAHTSLHVSVGDDVTLPTTDATDGPGAADGASPGLLLYVVHTF